MVDGREKTDLYTAYDKTIRELELPLMKTFIPDTKRYKKELAADKKTVFRSTLFPASRPQPPAGEGQQLGGTDNGNVALH